MHDAQEYAAGPAYPVAEHPMARTKGANAEDVRQLLAHELSRSGIGVTDFADRIGINPRTLSALLRGLNTRGGTAYTVTATVLDRILIGLGLEHERCRWGCLAA